MEIAIVDDEVLWRDRICKELRGLFQEDMNIYTFMSGDEFVKKNKPYDVVFFDVELGEGELMDGLELCKKYKEKYSEQENIAIILTTHTEYMRHGYISNAFRYIDKGNLNEELREAVSAIELRRQDQTCVGLHVSKLKRTEIKIDHIVCVETERRKLVMWLKNGESLYLDDGYTKVVEILEPYGLYEIRKGVIVNMKYITEVKNDFIILGHIMPEKKYYISRRRYSDFMRTFTEWRMKRALG